MECAARLNAKSYAKKPTGWKAREELKALAKWGRPSTGAVDEEMGYVCSKQEAGTLWENITMPEKEVQHFLSSFLKSCGIIESIWMRWNRFLEKYSKQNAFPQRQPNIIQSAQASLTGLGLLGLLIINAPSSSLSAPLQSRDGQNEGSQGI